MLLAVEIVFELAAKQDCFRACSVSDASYRMVLSKQTSPTIQKAKTFCILGYGTPTRTNASRHAETTRDEQHSCAASSPCYLQSLLLARQAILVTITIIFMKASARPVMAVTMTGNSALSCTLISTQRTPSCGAYSCW